MSELNLNDAVQINTTKPPLQGIIAHLDKVQFSEEGEWIGIRLTGPSVGLGDSDGFVEGVRYFQTGPNGAVFVRRANVEKRELTKLEQLKLKRELAKSKNLYAIPTASSSSTPSTAVTSNVGRSSGSKAPSKSSSLPSREEHATRTTANTKLEEIRRRRAELQSGRVDVTSSSTRREASSSSSVDSGSARTLRSGMRSEVSSTSVDTGRVKTSRDISSVKERRRQSGRVDDASTSSEKSLPSGRTRASRPSMSSEAPPSSIKAKASREKSSGKDVATFKAEIERLSAALQSKTDECSQMQSDLNRANSVITSTENSIQNIVSAIPSEEMPPSPSSSIETPTSTLLSKVDQFLQTLLSERNSLQSRLSDSEQQNKSLSSQISPTLQNNQVQTQKLQEENHSLRNLIEELRDSSPEIVDVDSDNIIENLVLEKENLIEERDALRDKIEELEIDLESANLELEDLKLEMEEVRQSSHTVVGVGSMSKDIDTNVMLEQNTKLKEALIQLRDQTSSEIMELSQRLDQAEKTAAHAEQLQNEFDQVSAERDTLKKEVEELKEMVDDSSALQKMIEELSDRILILEDDKTSLQSMIREMEEAADIAAETEEILAEENKTLLSDLETRDVTIANMEEAINIQRKREADYQRTFTKYHDTITTLKNEKVQLQTMLEGGEGEKMQMIAASQKALTRAAQFLRDAAVTRKKEAAAVLDNIDLRIKTTLSETLENILPLDVISSNNEVYAMKAELLLIKVSSEVSVSVSFICTMFNNALQKARQDSASLSASEQELEEGIIISDTVSQQIASMLHHTTFALLAVDAGSEAMRIFIAGQWPDLLSVQSSSDLASALFQPFSEFDYSFTGQLRLLIEEGMLSPQNSNFSQLQESLQDVRAAVGTVVDSNGNEILGSDWDPPNWQILRYASMAKLMCLGSLAALSSAIYDENLDDRRSSMLSSVIYYIGTTSNEIHNLESRLNGLTLLQELPSQVLDQAKKWKMCSQNFFDVAKSMLSAISSKGKIPASILKECASCMKDNLLEIRKFSFCLRKESNSSSGDEVKTCPCLWIEVQPSWQDIVNAIGQIKGSTEENINFYKRSKFLRKKISDAFEHEKKLEVAYSNITDLEKNLSSRSKETEMQNARVEELEQLLAQNKQTNSDILSNNDRKGAQLTEEIANLKKEIQFLSEANEVGNKQIEEYEKEIRFLKDISKGRITPTKRPNTPLKLPTPALSTSARTPARTPARTTPARTPARPTSARTTPHRSYSADPGFTSPDSTIASLSNPVFKSPALEAALFRPSLFNARKETAIWKAEAMRTSLANLPPLSIPKHGCVRRTAGQPQEGESSTQNDFESIERCKEELRLAAHHVRLTKASFCVPDFTRTDISPRMQLRQEKDKLKNAMQRLEEASLKARNCLSKVSK